jgi:hypothetical protein
MVWPSLASVTAAVPFWTTPCTEGEAAGVVLAGVGVEVPFGVSVALTLGDGDAAVAVGVAVSVAEGPTVDVTVGLGAVEVTDFDEHAPKPSRSTPQRPMTGQARRRGPCAPLPMLNLLTPI